MKRLLAIAAVIGWAFVFALVPNDAWAERRVALVVGNSSYTTVPRLPNPTRDAGAIAKLLKEAGFETVETYLDVGNLDFKRAIRKFEDISVEADVAVLYYAGHGIEIGGINYLIPVDARLASDRDAPDEAIPLDRLVLSADGAKKLRLIILDACRDNPFAGKMRRESRAAMRGVSAGLSKVEPSSTDTLIAYAAKAGSTAEDGELDHSPFTSALLKHLTVPGLDLRLAFGRVKDEVMKSTNNRQEPYVYGSLGGGNFSLVPPPPEPKGPTLASINVDAKADYELVDKIGTRRAFEVFLNTHKEGFYSDLARERIKSLPDAPAVALAPQPQINHGPSTRELIDWEKVKDSSSIEALRSFIGRYPGSNLSIRAQTRLEILEAAAKEREAKARADAERQRAEAAAAKRREEEERRAAAAEAAQKAKALEAERKAEAARLRAEEAARNKAAAEAERLRIESEKSARLAEEERRKAELAAAQEAICKTDSDRFDALSAKENTPANVEDLRRLAKETSCERVRPQIVAKLDAWTANTPALIKVAQTELTRINCFTGEADGVLSDATRSSLSRYLSVKKRSEKDPRVTEDLVGELQKQAAFTCPTICGRGETAQGASCVASKPAPAKTVKRREPERPRKQQAERRPEPRQQPQRQPPRQQASSGGGGGRASTMMGVGF
jgi:pyruvate/2-oxoglutarate dehydrogenase complex dihydrolipoamide acyltransferase (E2) component